MKYNFFSRFRLLQNIPVNINICVDGGNAPHDVLLTNYTQKEQVCDQVRLYALAKFWQL